MKGPLHVIRRRRAERPAVEADAEQTPTQAQPAADPGPAAASGATSQAAIASGGEAPPGAVPGDQPTVAVPAGQEPVPPRPSFRHRGRLRRRLRYLRRVRELGFRDLGGLVFDQHRFSSVNEELVRGKLAALTAVDSELRTLELALDDRRPITELREPGVSVCARCGALHGSDARFCPSCGIPVRGPLAIGEAVSLAAPVPPPPPEPKPAPAAEAQPGGVTEQPTEAMRPVAEPAVEPATETPRFVQPTAEHSEP